MYNLEKTNIKYNKQIKSINLENKPRCLKISENIIYENKFSANPVSINNIINNIRNNYETIEINKKNNSIINLDCKSVKEYSYLQYMNNKHKWLKSMNSNR